MVTPADFLAFAESLKESIVEIDRRSAISRAYYAAFHHLQAVAEERVGLPNFGTADDHRDIGRAVVELNEDVADKFQHLRRLRVLADYGLHRQVDGDQANESCRHAPDPRLRVTDRRRALTLTCALTLIHFTPNDA